LIGGEEMQSKKRTFRKDTKAASPAISMVVIVAATVVLVMISGSVAIQILERQKTSAEFDVVAKSFLTLDDALKDVAWDRGGSRSVRFTTNYGAVALLAENKSLNIRVNEYPDAEFPNLLTGVVKYSVSTSYITYGNGYNEFMTGSNTSVISSTSDSFSQLLANQQSGYLTLALNYRIRVAEEGPSSYANYIDILMIRLNCTNLPFLTGEFDLVARNIGVTTQSFGPFPAGRSSATVSVSTDGGPENHVVVGLNSGLPVIFNLIVADVRVSP
jgi:hypothetical protein